MGERSEACILAALLKAGRTVLIPFGDNQRYDLVIDEDGLFLRVQCKTGRIRGGVVKFQPSSCAGGAGAKRGYRGEADLFGVYCPDNEQVYLVPVEDVGVGASAYLRVDPPLGGDRKDIRWAHRYALTA